MSLTHCLVGCRDAAAKVLLVNVDAALPRVVSALDPRITVRAGGCGMLDFADISLKAISFWKAWRSKTYISFIHAYPSGVDTGLVREVPGGRILLAVPGMLLLPFMVLL